jgi:hypothetical protein
LGVDVDTQPQGEQKPLINQHKPVEGQQKGEKILLQEEDELADQVILPPELPQNKGHE